MKRIGLAVLLLSCAVLGCASNPAAPTALEPRQLNKSEAALVSAGNGFGMTMLGRLVKAKPGENVVISPVSISMALGMTMNGARNETLDSMRAVLGFGTLTQEEINSSYQSLMVLLNGLDPSATMAIANSIWYDDKRLAAYPGFIATNKKYFDADTRSLNFDDPNASTTMNQWVAEKTKGKIKAIVPNTIPSAAVMYLINALYFKGAWCGKFDAAKTRDDNFMLADGSSIRCNMMERTGSVGFATIPGATVVDIPYGNQRFSMMIALPDSGRTINDLVRELTPTVWQNWQRSSNSRTITLHMPRFTLGYEETLNDVLKAMGMGPAFDSRADFRGIGIADAPMYISDVRHKTFVDVSEEGTEAAAATSVEVSTVSMGSKQPPVIRFDHPFLVVIHEKTTGAILFIGTVMRP